jgi:hypothetical protein
LTFSSRWTAAGFVHFSFEFPSSHKNLVPSAGSREI